MWRHTPALLRNSLRLERWPVAVPLTQTKRVTGGGTQAQWVGGPVLGQATPRAILPAVRPGQRQPGGFDRDSGSEPLGPHLTHAVERF
jgi:hypothetical protein